MLELKQITKKYQHQTVLGPLEFSLEKGLFLGLLGPNGSGKSTLLYLIAGSCKPTSGEIYWDNNALDEESHEDIAFLPDRNPFPVWMNTLDALKLHTYFFDDFDESKCKEYLKMFNIPLKKRINQLSKGNLAKVKLILLLARKAKLFVLDEPFEGMDLPSRKKMLKLLAELLHDNCSIILSSHFVNEVDQLFTDVLFLKEGKVVLYQDKDTLLAEMGLSLEDIFNEIYSEEYTDADLNSL